MKKIYILFIGIVMPIVFGYSQSNEKSIVLSGKVIDAETAQALEYATITIHKENDSIVSGAATNAKGVFSIKLNPDEYIIKVSFLSFKTRSFSITSYNSDKDFGTIALSPDNTLEEVKITAEKQLMEVKFNKRIYNASSDILNRGGNAIDVLNNTPSVRVNEEGAIIIRGATTNTILIDGKPQFGLNANTDILKSMPSNSIDKIEIITRSAKYSSSGGGAIINIVTKKRLGKGFSGSIEGHTGIPDNHGFSTFLNEDSDKINLYSTISFNHSNNLKITDYNQPEIDLFTKNNQDRIHNGTLFSIGSDFYPNANSSINTSLLVNFLNKNNFSNISASDFSRNGTDKEDNTRIEAQIGYTRNFNNEGHKLTTNFRYETTFSNTKGVINEFQTLGNSIFQNSFKKQDLNSFDAQLDYALPTSDQAVLQLGYRATARFYENNFLVEQFNNTIGNFETVNSLDNIIDYNEIVHGIYGQYDYNFKKLSLSLGLRTEISDIKIKDAQNNITLPKDYTDIFPSLNFGYEFSEKSYLSLNYSRSIERPDISQISPFISFSDERFQSVGNLDLNPYYNNYFELLFDTNFEKFSLASSLFINLNKDSFLTIFENSGQQTDNGDVIFIRSIINSGNQNLFGFDVDFTYKPTKWLRLRGYISPYREEITNAIDDQYNVTNDVIYTSGNTIVSLDNGFRFNFGYTYQSKLKLNGLREQKPLHWANVAISKDFLDNKATLTLKANDLFATKRGKMVSFEENIRTLRNVFFENQFNLTFTYRFNQKRKSNKDKSDDLKKDALEDKQDKF